MNKSESKYYNTALLMDEALLILLEKKEFEYITVKEICQKAGVNRSTFYLHYENTSDLLEETIGYINDKIKISFSEKIEDVNSINKNDLFFVTPKYLIPYLTLVKENKKIFKLIHNKPHLFKNKQTAEMLYHDLFSVILTKYNVAENLKKYGVPVVITANRFPSDTDLEINQLRLWCEANNYMFALNEGAIKGSDGALELATKVNYFLGQETAQNFKPLYNFDEPILDKIEKICKEIYRASNVIINEDILKLAGDKGSSLGTGGMVTKLRAATIATNAGCEMVIANGANPSVLYDIVEGKKIGTRFKA